MNKNRSASSLAAMTFPFPASPSGAEPVTITPGINWLRMPMPYALDHVNIYLVRVDKGWMVIDSGIDSPESRSIWDSIFSGALQGENIVGMYCTHFHVDHMGLAGYLAERFRVPLLATYEEFFSCRGWPTALDNIPWQHELFFRTNGFPEELLEQTLAMFRFSTKIFPLPPAFTRLKDGCRLPVDGGDWQVITGRGHSPEHALLFSPQQKILISGDQLLPGISTNVSVSPVNPEDNPLSDWLATLDRLDKLPDDMLVLPGHGLPFRGMRTRVAELRAHHEHKFAVIRDACAIRALTAYELVAVLYKKPLSDFDLQLAFGESLAHIRCLHIRGHLSRAVDARGVIRYTTLTTDRPCIKMHNTATLECLTGVTT